MNGERLVVIWYDSLENADVNDGDLIVMVTWQKRLAFDFFISD